MVSPRLIFSTLLGCAALCSQLPAQAVAPQRAVKAQAPAEQARWMATAKRVTIMRDKWGIPHVFGKTDADAVFGLLYAQAEDDFNRVELNYINALGRLAEVEGEGEIWRDLRMKMFITPQDMQAKYAASPAWLKQLMVAFADGLNFYLHTHPEVKPKLLTHFEPWMALAFSEGSIGGDIESIDLKKLEQLYGKRPQVALADNGTGFDPEPRGSNGFAIAPKRSASGHALLLINPHTSFYFRPEVHMVSGEGLNAYGAVTWGQFFVYQGFNERAGWMHTSGGGDVIDEYLETVTEKDGKFIYQYGGEQRPMRAVPITLPYKTAGGMASKTVTAYFTHHGPVVREAGGKWVSVKLMEEPLKALTQSYTRTKATNYAAFYKSMELRTNSSNNTVYADADGTIAYFHGNFVPKRDPAFDWVHPVDGSNPATEWKGLHEVKDTITLHNPASGYILNTNNWPFASSGASSPRQADYPAYMWSLPENARGLHAVKVLKDQSGFTLDSLIATAYDSYLTGFEPLVPALVADWEALAAGRSAQGATGGAGRGAARLGPAVFGRFGSDFAGGVLGPADGGGGIKRGARPGNPGGRFHQHPAVAAGAPAGAGARFGQAGGGLRQLANAVGRDQPLPAHQRRCRPAVRRQQAELSGGVYVGHLGLAGVVRHGGQAEDQAHLRRPRQQLRGGGRVRAAPARQKHPGRRRERQPGVEALQRPGRNVQQGPVQGRAVLQGGHRKISGAKISSGRIVPWRTGLFHLAQGVIE